MGIIPFIVLCGCNSGRGQLVGTWTGTIEIEAPQGVDKAAFETFRNVRLQCYENGRFLLELTGLPYEGEWSFNGKTGTLKIDRLLNQPIEKASAENAKRNWSWTISSLGDKKIRVTDPDGISIESFELIQTSEKTTTSETWLKR